MIPDIRRLRNLTLGHGCATSPRVWLGPGRFSADRARNSPYGDDRNVELVRFDEGDEAVRAEGVRHFG